jgi:hypothetical protein
MPTKARRKAKRKPLSEKQRASDERLRDTLRNADMGKFDKVLTKAMKG